MMIGKDSKFKTEGAETIIGSGVKVEGTFVAVGNVVLKGELIGSLETKSNLDLEEGGKIEADIKAKNALIAGEVKGNLEVAEKIELASSAKVLGDLDCRVLAIEEGAVLSGRCSVGGQSPAGNARKGEKTETEEE